MLKRDYSCEFEHLGEMDVSFVGMVGQRLDIVKFPRIIAGESEGVGWSGGVGGGCGSAVIPGIPLIWSYMACFTD